MRILYINSGFGRQPSLPYERAKRLAADLTSLGAEVIAHPSNADRPVGDRGGASKKAIRTQLRRLPAAICLRLLDVNLIRKGVSRTLIDSLYLIRRFAENPPDVVLARVDDYDWTPWVVAALLKRPLVLELHQIGGFERQQRGNPFARSALFAERLSFTQPKRIWVVSQELEGLVQMMVDDPDKVRCIVHGIEPVEDFTDARNQDGLVRVIFIGSFYPWHGTDILLLAFARAARTHPELHLTFAGDGLFRSEAEHLARRLGIAARTAFTGWLPRREMLKLLRKCDIGVAPYLPMTSFYFRPAKILDYMSAGLAIVASGQGEVNRMIDHGRTGLLVQPGDVQELEAALARLVLEPAWREALGRSALAALGSIGTAREQAASVLQLCYEAAIMSSPFLPTSFVL